MKIPVIFIDGTPGVVGAEELDSFVQKRRILSFRRSDGWVRVSRDPVREPSSKNTYEGKDRRKA
ncbi:GSU3473 family protein [Geobacter sp. AOG2]|uniref:GSU3473 family protein n=1 Tax=Geobacter sp. AOG2 TaxID=1566347 RepID=UPI001CC3BD2F|nr:hypothetical protein [Geobacter sp. AOG2]